MSRPPPGGVMDGVRLQHVLPRLAKGGPEQRAIDAGEIDAVIDYAHSNVILLPAARHALRQKASLEGAWDIPVANSLLAALPRAEYQRLLPDLEPVTLNFNERLQEENQPIRHIYFPIRCVISLLATAGGNQSLEVGMVGPEGMVGISLALEEEVASVRAMVHVAGTAVRMKAAPFSVSLAQCPSLQRALHRYARAKMALAQQTVACNRFHAVEARLACWLLMTGDRAASDEFFLTQAFLAKMLGVRRATVNEAAGPLQRRKLISYRRGTMRILDRRGLEAVSCECYAST